VVTAGRYAAVVLAGGAGRRLGGVAKPALAVGGRPMLHRVLAAVAGARPRVVVGPATLPVPAEVVRTLERSPGGGPVPAIAAGLALVPPEVGYLALLAADLPLLTAAAVGRLRAAAAAEGVDGAVYLDRAGRPQWLCGVWRTAALRARLGAGPADLAGVPVHRLLSGLVVTPLVDPGPGPPPWWDCDTDQQLRRAEEMVVTEPMATLEEWTAAAAGALGLDPAGPAGQPELVLDLARAVAHRVARPAAPVSAYLLGLAVGRGADPEAAAAALTALARQWPPAPAG
jgi:molybdopterin-guanine dinucleotide biosynthesis protein A